ncbi:leucyl aminopeptidase [Thermodesulfobacteriota bacterium]
MLELKSIDLNKEKTATLVIPVCEDKAIHDYDAIPSLIKKAKKIKEFAGHADEELTLYNPSGVKAERVVFLGLGKLETFSAEMLRSFSGRAVKKCIRQRFSEMLIAVPSEKKVKTDISTLMTSLLEGACLGNHLFDKYKKEKKHNPLKRIGFLVKPDDAKAFKNLPKKVETVCGGTILAREWVSMPPNDKRPEQFTKTIVGNAEKAGLKIDVLAEKDLKRKKFGAMLAVAAGSDSKPSLVVLEHKPKKAKKTVALVGKGVTFDSGGINLKPADGLDGMKMDMSGAAAVAATLISAAKLRLPIRVIGFLPIVENMPSGNATRPGDIVRSYESKTVEIGNTDAEGRLILIDAMAYAIEQYQPDILIDLATLTGACIVALGEKIAGVFSLDKELADDIVESGEIVFERCWRMPMPDDYKELLKSDFADIKNISNTRWGGAITAALFLAEFVKDTRWAHIDIAGPAYLKKADSYCGVGGTGFGVRLLCDLLEKL